MKPFFSLIVPCCDVARYLRACLDSVTAQPFTNWECILGVEASRDATEAIAREYVAKDPRFRMFTAPRSGSCSASRNTGIDRACGEYIIFLDGDDFITPGSLQRIHGRIALNPGADIYPCAMQVHNDFTGKDEELRDNHPSDFDGELTGPEAVLQTYRVYREPCPMLQLSVFRRAYLVERKLKCLYGLKRQDSEFAPRAFYFAKRVVPIHEPFYIYRIREGSVSTLAKTTDYFLDSYAGILKSLFAFHAEVSHTPGFDSRLSRFWARHWLKWLYWYWFAPQAIAGTPRRRRRETLQNAFPEGFADFDALARHGTRPRRIAGGFMKLFVRRPSLGFLADFFFRRLYFPASARLARSNRAAWDYGTKTSSPPRRMSAWRTARP